MIRPPPDWLSRRGRQTDRILERMSSNRDKKPLGKALDWTDADLDRLSEIQDGDFDKARAEVTDEMREIVDAEETSE